MSDKVRPIRDDALAEWLGVSRGIVYEIADDRGLIRDTMKDETGQTVYLVKPEAAELIVRLVSREMLSTISGAPWA